MVETYLCRRQPYGIILLTLPLLVYAVKVDRSTSWVAPTGEAIRKNVIPCTPTIPDLGDRLVMDGLRWYAPITCFGYGAKVKMVP